MKTLLLMLTVAVLAIAACERSATTDVALEHQEQPAQNPGLVMLDWPCGQPDGCGDIVTSTACIDQVGYITATVHIDTLEGFSPPEGVPAVMYMFTHCSGGTEIDNVEAFSHGYANDGYEYHFRWPHTGAWQGGVGFEWFFECYGSPTSGSGCCRTVTLENCQNNPPPPCPHCPDFGS